METEHIIFLNGEQWLKTKMDAIHHQIPFHIKEKYEACPCLFSRTNISASHFLKYDPSDNTFKQNFAQILKRRSGRDYLVLVKASSFGDSSVRMKTFESYWEARRSYKSICDDFSTPFGGSQSIVATTKYKDICFFRQLNGLDLLEPQETYRRIESDWKLDKEKMDFVNMVIPDVTDEENVNCLKTLTMGYPTERGIDEAFKILDNLERLLTMGPRASDIGYICASGIHFHMFIPSFHGEDKQVPMLNTVKKVHEMRILLNKLRSRSFLVKKIESYYARILERLGRLDFALLSIRGTPLYHRINDCITDSCPSYEVVNAFSFDTSPTPSTSGERNNMLLWHGIRNRDVYNILDKGLQIPTEDPKGRTCATGIYFSELASKSARYCVGNDSGPYSNIVLLLNEVQLGRMKSLDMNTTKQDFRKVPEGYDSVKIIGLKFPSENEYVVDEFGGKMYTGKPLRDVEFFESVYLVYDTARIKTRYLVHLRQRK